MRITVLIFGAFLSADAWAQERPHWVSPLPFGEIECRTEISNGFKWHRNSGKYDTVRFPARTFTIQKLNADDPKYAEFNCGAETKPSTFALKNEYVMAACYRYNNATNIMGWIQGWCTEKYQKDGKVHVTCETERTFQPKIGFSPNGYFYSYGRYSTRFEGDPFIRLGFTEIGQCARFLPAYFIRFKVGREDAYYAPSK